MIVTRRRLIATMAAIVTAVAASFVLYVSMFSSSGIAYAQEQTAEASQQIGLEKGDLTNDEIAAKVVKEFFEALIAKDYTKAASLGEGIPAEEMKTIFGPTRFVRIVEIGKPVSGALSDPKALKVPVKLEFEITSMKRVRSGESTVQIADAEKAVKAVRDSFEAVIKRDEPLTYQDFLATGLIPPGLTEEQVKTVKEALDRDHVKFLRIVEVGDPVPHPENGTTKVPVKIEQELSTGGVQARELSAHIRPVHGQPDRWAIYGGI